MSRIEGTELQSVIAVDADFLNFDRHRSMVGFGNILAKTSMKGDKRETLSKED